MNEADRVKIDALFGRLSETSTPGGESDPDAEAYVLERLTSTPGTAYALVRALMRNEGSTAAVGDRRVPVGNDPAGAGRRESCAGWGTTIREMLPSAAQRQRIEFDPDDVDALGFDDEPDRR